MIDPRRRRLDPPRNTGLRASVLGAIFAGTLFAAPGEAPVADVLAADAPAAFALVADAPVADAAQRGNLEAVRALLREGGDVNAAQGDGMTALHWAALRGDVPMTEVLVYAGANPESTTRIGGYTALHLAAKDGRADVVALLLARGAKPNATTNTGVTPLHFAAASGSTGAVGVLLEHGASIDAGETANGQTPLMFAAAAGRQATLEALIVAGADLTVATHVVDFSEREQTDRAARTRRQQVVAVIRKAEAEARGEVVENDSRFAPRTDAPSGQAPTAQDQQSQRDAGEDATLAKAAKVEKPADAEPKQEAGGAPDEDPELAAAPQGAESPPAAEPPHEEEPPRAAEPPDEDPELSGVPHEEGPPAEVKAEEDEARADADESKTGEAESEDAEAKTEDAVPEPKALSYAQLVGRQGGLTALHYAVRDGHLEVVTSLLAAGADIDVPTGGDASTPLLMAAINGRYDMALYLLDEGADPNLASEDGVAPLYAVISNRWAPKALYPQPTAFKQQDADYLEMIEALLQRGADPTARTETHIWYASFNFDLLGVNFSGATPFWRAAYALDVPAMELLAANGAEPNTPTKKAPARRRFRPTDEDEEKEDPSGLPPVDVGGPGIPPIVAAAGVGYGRARAGNSHRHAPDSWLAAARYLVEVAGADVNARDHDGYSALHYAAARGDNDLISYLVEKGADPTVVARSGQTTVDMANGPIQRVQPFPETIALLESLGAVNNHNCVSC